MAVTYADLVAFGFAYVEDNVLPNYKKQKLSVRKAKTSLLSSEDMCLCEEEDFIIFAEFSEVKGPVPLFTVPSYIQHDEKIDINSFIMRIMSVDYQANPGTQFCICQDTQILQSNVSHGRHAYVHYFTLYDLHARGFVRPLCIAYVSSNHYKLHKIFPHLRDQFLKVTEMIKVNNWQHLKTEILSVLYNIEDKTLAYENLTEEIKETGITCDLSKLKQHGQCMQQFEDFNIMLKIVEASLANVEYTVAALDHWRNTLTYRDELTSSKELQDYITLLSSTSMWKNLNLYENTCTLEKQLRPIPVLSPWGTACSLTLLLNIRSNFGSCELSVSIGCFPPLSSPEDHFGKISASPNACEAVENTEFLQLLQAIAVGAIDASTPSLEDQEPAHYLVEESSSKETTSGNEGSSSYHSFSDSTCDHVKNSSIKCDSHTSSIEAADGNVMGKSQEMSPFHDSVHTTVNDAPNVMQSENRDDFCSVIDGYSTPNPSNNSNLPDNIYDEANHSQNQYSCSVSTDSSSNDSESFHDILEAFHSDDNWSVGSVHDTLPLGVPWDHCLWTRHKPTMQSGHRLLKFFWTFRSAAQHVLYSLLTGRTLVLAGDSSSEQRVQRIMSALSPLIPPLDNNGLRVLRWHQGILVSTHIASYQLIGMCIPERLSIHDMISPRDKNSATILDVNSEQLFGPAYHGNLLAAVGHNIRDFPSDHSLLLYMESVLHGIGQKLVAYKSLVAACDNDIPSHICRQLDIHGCDADIIRYLSKLSL